MLTSSVWSWYTVFTWTKKSYISIHDDINQQTFLMMLKNYKCMVHIYQGALVVMTISLPSAIKCNLFNHSVSILFLQIVYNFAYWKEARWGTRKSAFNNCCEGKNSCQICCTEASLIRYICFHCVIIVLTMFIRPIIYALTLSLPIKSTTLVSATTKISKYFVKADGADLRNLKNKTKQKNCEETVNDHNVLE